MPQVDSNDRHALLPTLSSSLGVKGSLRVRAYGNVKHAHVVLRKVEEEEYEDNHGQKRRRGIFSIFAHKLINVKAGKELYLYLHPANGGLKELPIAFEGELLGEGEETLEVPDNFPLPPAQVEEKVDVYVSSPQEQQAIPPKMRKLWAKRNGVGAKPVSDCVVPPVALKTSAETQTEQPLTSVEVQTTLTPIASSSAQTITTPSASSATQTIMTPSKSSGTQTKRTRPVDTATQTPPLNSSPRVDAGVQTVLPMYTPQTNGKVVEQEIHVDLSTQTDARDQLRSFSRSLSPMELDSPLTTPPQSPVLTPSESAAVAIRSKSRSLSTTPRRQSVASMELSRASSATSIDTDIRSSRTASPTNVKPHRLPKRSHRDKLPSLQPINSIQSAPASMTVRPPLAEASALTVAPHRPVLQAPTPIVHSKSPPEIQPIPTPTPSSVALGKRKRVESPFISGGFITSPLATIVPPITDATRVVLPPSKGSVSQLGTLQRSRAVVANATASSSKVTLEQLPHPSRPNGPAKTIDTLSGLLTSIAPPVSVHGQKRSLSPSLNSTLSKLRSSNNTLYTQSTPSRPHDSQSIVPKSVDPLSPWMQNPLLSGLLRPPITTTVEERRVYTSKGSGIPPTATEGTPISGANHLVAASPTRPSPLQSINMPSSKSTERIATGSDPMTIKTEPQSPSLAATAWLPGWKPIKSDGPPNKQMHSRNAISVPQDPIYIQDDIEYGPPKPPSEPRSQATDAKAEGRELLPPKPPVQNGNSGGDQHYTGNRHYTGGRFRTFLSQSPGPDSTQPEQPSLPPKPQEMSKRKARRSQRSRKRRADANNYEPDFSANFMPLGTRQTPSLKILHTAEIKFDEGFVGIRAMLFNSTGSQFAVICHDHTIRIWNNHNQTEVAKLAHNAAVVSFAWMKDDAGVVSLGRNGIVNKWTKVGQNQWHWAKILDAGDPDPHCFDYRNDRIAVGYPRVGIKVWFWAKAHWQLQRVIQRVNVVTMRFMGDGEALIGGTTDGVLWHSEVSTGIVRAYTFFKTKVFCVDIGSAGNHVVVAQAGGRAHLVGLGEDDQKGKILQVYSTRELEITPIRANHAFGATFASHDDYVVFGAISGRVLVWDRINGSLKHELDHGNDIMVQSVASYDGPASESYLLTANRLGKLTWWAPPSSTSEAASSEPNSPAKRPRRDWETAS